MTRVLRGRMPSVDARTVLLIGVIWLPIVLLLMVV